jgi:hypothetical protein
MTLSKASPRGGDPAEFGAVSPNYHHYAQIPYSKPQYQKTQRFRSRVSQAAPLPSISFKHNESIASNNAQIV